MIRKFSGKAILSAILIAIILIEPVFSISVGFSASSGRGTVSASESYKLDVSTSLTSSAVLSGSEMSHSRQLSGSGQNDLKQKISGDHYSIDNSVSGSGALSISSSSEASSASGSLDQSLSGLGETTSSQSISVDGSSVEGSVSNQGSLSTSSSSSASSGEASLSQEVLGGGNAALAVTGTKGEDNSVQKASVENGLIASSQSASAGAGISASQRTAINGETGSLGSGVISSKNNMLVSGSFTSSGSMDADLRTEAADQASTHGKFSVNGGTLVDDSKLNQVQSGSVGLKVEGQRVSPEGDDAGSFEVNVVNMACKDGCDNGKDSGSSTDGYKLLTGSIEGGQTLPMKWTQDNPQIQLYLVGSTVPKNLDTSDVSSAISTAANTWDDAVAQNLFADGTTVQVDDSKQVVPQDATQPVGSNTQGWRTLSDNENGDGKTSAITYTWFGNPIVNGYYSIHEADTAYNSKLSWSTTGGKYDVQSVALHELGHSIGLDDVNDPNQVMNKCYEFNHDLGSGDIAGAQFLYGQPGSQPGGQSGLVPFYRLVNGKVGDHFYTTNQAEAQYAESNLGYISEGIACYIYTGSQTGTIPFYRLCSPTDHFYTTNQAEAQYAESNLGYISEGIAGYLYPDSQTGTVPFYRLMSPSATDHFYTINQAEVQNAESNLGYISEGIAGNVENTQ